MLFDQKREKASVRICFGVQLTHRGEIVTRYVLFSWLLLWLAFLEVNKGENCSQSCLEDTGVELEAL